MFKLFKRKSEFNKHNKNKYKKKILSFREIELLSQSFNPHSIESYRYR